MKNILALTVKFIVFSSTVVQAQKLDGAYSVIEAQYGDKPATAQAVSQEKVIKIFKDGYWIGAFFGRPDKPFNGTCGGTYKLQDGKYIETVNFYSWDSTAVGKVYSFDYALSASQYLQTGYMDSEKYKHFFIKEKYEKVTAKEALQNNSLEGAWKMQTGKWGESSLGSGTYKDVSVIKIYAFPRFAFAYYNEKTKGFVGAGGGTYQYDGKTLSEKIEYWSWPKLANANPVFEITLSGNQYIQASADKQLVETWQRLK